MNLDFTEKEFRELLEKSSIAISEFYAGLEDMRVFPAESSKAIDLEIRESLPESSEDPHAMIDFLINRVLKTSTLNPHPNFFAYVISGGNQIGILADLFAAALNQCCVKSQLAPMATAMEKICVQWLGEFIGYPAQCGGVLVSGGSEANLTGLAIARDSKAKKMASTYYASVETHSCVEKSLRLMGVERDLYRKIPVKKDFTIDLLLLEKSIQADLQEELHPTCIIANAGTVNTGAVDPIADIVAIAKKYDLWLHVDGSYGAPAAGLPSKRSLFLGLESADSIAIDPHKWFQVPFEAGCVLVKNMQDLKSSFSVLPDYLNTVSTAQEPWAPMEHNFKLSRSFKALKIWLTFKVYGAAKLRQVIADNIAVMHELKAMIEAEKSLDLVVPPVLSVVCFRYRGKLHDEDKIEALNCALIKELEKDGRIFLASTKIGGKTVLRACCVNHRTETKHVKTLLDVVLERGAQLEKILQAAM